MMGAYHYHQQSNNIFGPNVRNGLFPPPPMLFSGVPTTAAAAIFSPTMLSDIQRHHNTMALASVMQNYYRGLTMPFMSAPLPLMAAGRHAATSTVDASAEYRHVDKSSASQIDAAKVSNVVVRNKPKFDFTKLAESIAEEEASLKKPQKQFSSPTVQLWPPTIFANKPW